VYKCKISFLALTQHFFDPDILRLLYSLKWTQTCSSQMIQGNTIVRYWVRKFLFKLATWDALQLCQTFFKPLDMKVTGSERIFLNAKSYFSFIYTWLIYCLIALKYLRKLNFRCSPMSYINFESQYDYV